MSGMELIFFIAACFVLCFGLVTRTYQWLITHECFSYCRTAFDSIRACKVSHTVPPASRVVVCKMLGRNKGWRADPKWPKRYSIPCDLMFSIKSLKKEGGRGTFGILVFVFPINCHMVWGPEFQEAAKHLHTDMKQQMNALFCYACTCSFASVIKPSLSWPVSLFPFCLSVSLPYSALGGGKGEQATRWELSC